MRGSSRRPSSGAEWPRPFGVLLADERRQAEDARRLDQLGAGGGDAGERGIGTEALLDVDDDQRGAVAGEQAHQAPTIAIERSRCASAPAAIVMSTRPRSARPVKQQFSERLSQPCSPATQTASRSTSVKFAGAPSASGGRRQLEQGGAGGEALDEQ